MPGIAVIGGGASGMMASIAAKRSAPGVAVTVFERMDRLGKKLLATGNGRCNYTNTDVSVSNYYGVFPEFCEFALSTFDNNQTIAFFEGLGIVPHTEEDGKVFPYSGTAAALLDALRFEMERLGIETVLGIDVTGITAKNSGENRIFEITCSSGATYEAERVIVSAGGQASRALGSNGSGYALMQSLEHCKTPLRPALVRLNTAEHDVKPLQGIKVECVVTALQDEKHVSTEDGEVLFTATGLSGPPVFQLSAKYAAGYVNRLSLDLCPHLTAEALAELLEKRRQSLGHLTCENYFTGFLNKRVGNLIFRRCGVEKLSLRVSNIGDSLISEMARHIKSLVFTISGDDGFDNAQVTAGGVKTCFFNPETMESLKLPGLYATGEILDIYGDCGGFNLQWAWSSGHLAGVSAAESMLI